STERSGGCLRGGSDRPLGKVCQVDFPCRLGEAGMRKIPHFLNTPKTAITELFGPRCLETGEVSAIFELDGKRYGLFGSLEWVEELIKANGGGDPLTALEKSIREDLASIDAEAEREAEAEEETNEAAAVVRDILAGRLRP